MQTETSQTLAVVSLPMMLIVGWVIAAAFLAYGGWRRQTRFLQLGLAATGLMSLVSPLAWYTYAASRPDLYVIGIPDLLILAFLAFLGGGVLISGLVLPRFRSVPAGKR